MFYFNKPVVLDWLKIVVFFGLSGLLLISKKENNLIVKSTKNDFEGL